MKMSEGTADSLTKNSPFWYWDGWTLCNFQINHGMAGAPGGHYHRGLSAWGIEKRYEVGEEGYWNID